MKPYFTEDELIEKYQNNEIDLLYFVQHNPNYDSDFEDFCKEKGLEPTPETAWAFLEESDRKIEEGESFGPI